MPVPLALAAPAAIAGLAYLNARTSFWYDVKLAKCNLTAAYRALSRERKDRISMFYVLEDYAKNPASADRALLWFEGRTWTYADVYDTVLRYGTWLREKHGIQRGDIVAMDMQNSELFIFMWFALWAIGAKPAFMNYNLTGAALTHCLKVANTKLCIIDPEVQHNVGDDVRKDNPQVNFVVFTPEVQNEAVSTQPVRYPDQDRSEDKLSNLAILIYTSGTTGMPKPAVVAWGKVIVGGSIAHILLNRWGDDSIMYTSMPLYHSSASVLSLCAGLLGGATQALGRKFSTRGFWDDVRASRATSIQYVGETLRYLLAAPPQYDPATGECLDRQHRVKVAFGNGLRPDVWNRFKDRFGIESIAEFYAATESPLGTWNFSSNDMSAGAMGRRGWIYLALAKSASAVVEIDWDTAQPKRDPTTGFCKRVEMGQPGEVLAKLDENDPGRRFQGYYGNKKATQSKVLTDVFRKGDMYFRTGDVVRWTDDGLVFFHDRIGDTFRWKSENVSTAEVSQTVGTHPAVREANVYGVELPHHDGRAGCAAVWLDADDAATLRSLAGHVRKTLPRYAQPLFLRVQSVSGSTDTDDEGAAAANRTGTNKQQKSALRQAGVKPGGDNMGALYWLQGDEYVPFGESQWRELESGRVKL